MSVPYSEGKKWVMDGVEEAHFMLHVFRAGEGGGCRRLRMNVHSQLNLCQNSTSPNGRDHGINTYVDPIR